MTDDRKVPPRNKSPNVRSNQSMTQNHREKPKIGADSYSDVTFFTVCNDKYFPGLVGLLNSLRLMDHKRPLVVGDCGLTQRQRDLLAPFCTIYQLPGDLVGNPTQFKAFPYLLEPRGTVVIIDSDMIVTRPLGALLACAAEGKICIFPDPEKDRWFSEWQQIFGLSSVPRRQTYACAGLVVFSTLHWPTLLEQWWKACQQIFTHPTVQEGAKGATSQSDQDAFNALLMSEFPLDAVAFQPVEEQVFRWDFPRVELVDAKTLSCRHDGHEPTILHACVVPKPWESAGVRRNIYLHLLRRLLTAPDVELRVPAELLESWLRPGPWGELACYGLSLKNMSHPKRAVSLAWRLQKKILRILRKAPVT
jgi:hypothetical protein